MISQEYRARPRVSDAENIVRYVGASAFDRAMGLVNGSAFDRTPKDHDGVSVTRRGILAQDSLEDEDEIRRAVGSRLRLGLTAIFVELNVGEALHALAEFEQEVLVCEDPLQAENGYLPNPAHALILGLPFAGETVGSLRSEVASDRLRQIIRRRFPAVARPT